MSGTTCIRNAPWVVAWNAAAGRHEYLRDGDVAFADGAISFVGRGYDGPVGTEIDGRGRFVLPGFVDVHSHPMSEPLDKGFNEEAGSPALGMSGLYEYLPLMRPDQAGIAACAEVAYCELLLSGVTTLVDLSVEWPGWLELIARSGLRGVVAPMFRSARWMTPNGHEVRYEWDEAAGARGLEGAVRLVERARQHECGRLSGMLAPAQVDTCTEALLRDALAVAEEKRWPIQIHASQSVVEFQEMTRRHGVTPVQWLNRIGFTRPGSAIAHCIFTDHHSWLHWHSRDDLKILADTGTAVAHCPNVFVRRGITLESLGGYRRAGIEVGIGTDTYPHNFLDEMRWAATLSRVAAENVHDLSTADVLHAATIGGSAIVGRDDIGRLAPGARADLVLVDAAAPSMQPLRDPLRSLVYSAQDRAVRDVYVDGRQVVRDGRVLTLDYAAAAARVTEAQQRAAEKVPALDWAGRTFDQVSPLSLPEG